MWKQVGMTVIQTVDFQIPKWICGDKLDEKLGQRMILNPILMCDDLEHYLLEGF